MKHRTYLTMLQVALVAIVVASCSRTGTLSGDIYARASNGEIRRGADVQVVLVLAASGFDAKWQTLESEFKIANDDAMSRCRNICIEAWEVHDKYSIRATELIRANQGVSTRADINGRYELQDIAPGKYRLFAALKFAEGPRRHRLAWTIPVEIMPGSRKLDLAASNAGSTFDLDQLNAKTPSGSAVSK